MCASRRSALWPRIVAVSLIGLGAASCSSDSSRFSDIFGSNSSSRNDTTGSIPQSTPSGHVDSRPLPHLAGAEPQGSSGGGQGMASYQPNSEVTGSLPAAPPPPVWTWEGGTPITVAPGETLETISRQHGVPVSALMQANNITSPAMVHAGDHLVIPRRSPSAAAYTPPTTRIASTAPGMPVGAPRTALAPTTGMHVVAPGETLHSIARLYGKSVMVLATANNIRPDTMVKVGERIVIPGVQPGATVAPRAQAQVVPPSPSLATVESPHSARVATPEAPAQESTIKTA